MNPTWWARKDDFRPVGVVAETEEAALALVGPDFSVSLASETHPCSTCPHFDLCMGETPWGSFRLGHDGSDAKDYVSVHTCRTCMEKVIETMADCSTMIVPDDCPRWDPTFGSAIDCGGCRAEREAIRTSHPRYQEQVEATRKMMDAFMASIRTRQEHGPNVENLGEHKALSEATKEMSESYTPFKGRSLTDEQVQSVDALANALVFHSLSIPELRQAWETMEDMTKAMQVWDWLEALYLARQAHPDDAKKITHRWVLAFTERRMSRGWTRMSIPARKMLIRSWEKLVQEVLDARDA